MWNNEQKSFGAVAPFNRIVCSAGFSMWNNGERSRMDKMRDTIRNITTFHQRSKYADKDQRTPTDQSTPTTTTRNRMED